MGAVRERGGRLLKALTEEDSPALAKGMELLRGAQERASGAGEAVAPLLDGFSPFPPEALLCAAPSAGELRVPSGYACPCLKEVYRLWLLGGAFGVGLRCGAGVSLLGGSWSFNGKEALFVREGRGKGGGGGGLP